MKRFTTILITLFAVMNLLHAQDEKLSDMPVAQRNAAITAIAKAAFQREMPEVYREYGTPTIEQKIVTHNPQSYEASRYGEEYGDMFYMVTFPINTATESNTFPMGYASRIYVWDDTQEAFRIDYGSSEEGFGKILCKRDMR